MRASWKMLLCFFSVTTLSSYAFSEWTLTSENRTSKNWSFQQTNSRQAYLVMFMEGGAWNLSLMEIGDDGFQDIIQQVQFSRYEQALAKSKALMSEYLPKTFNPEDFIGTANAPLWKVTRDWSWSWEIRFGEWIAKEIEVDLFYKHKIKTDCADVPIYLRWIFARMHGLPAANRLMGSSRLMSQDSVRNEWAELPSGDEWYEDKKFLRMVDYVTANSNTHSIVEDGYSIAINKNSLFEGAYHVILHTESGHARVVYRTAKTNTEGALPFLIMDSNLPRMVRILAHGPFWEEEQPRSKSDGGFFRFRWPIKSGSGWKLLESDEMPNYSNEQFRSEFMTNKSYALSVMLRLRPDMNFHQAFDFGLQSIIDKLNERIPVVEQGYRFCRENDCSPGTTNYQNWSTPSRDQRISSIIEQTEEIVRLAVADGYDTDKKWQSSQSKEVLSLGDKKYTLRQMLDIWDNELFSSDPRSSIGRRWGVKN
ncbi:MAG: hypothetical protein AB7H97_00200 [Pseudobdellovibrionaceae bacterium]